MQTNFTIRTQNGVVQVNLLDYRHNYGKSLDVLDVTESDEGWQVVIL
jgi:hypothetical protein